MDGSVEVHSFPQVEIYEPGICIFIDGALAEGQLHWLWFAVFVIFFISQMIGHANMMIQNHARLSHKLKRKSRDIVAQQEATTTKKKSCEFCWCRVCV